MALICQECGSANEDSANFCSRCGTALQRTDPPPTNEPPTASYRIGETGELIPLTLDEVTSQGPTLVIRAGGGRVGESFTLSKNRMTVGRRPDSDVFLDDVTVSRDHAVLVRRGEEWHLDDCGSLNGTYVNRERIESHRLSDGDELQIGKYKLSYISR